MKTKWQDPEYRAKITSSMSEVMKLRWQDPNYIAFKTQAKLEQWQDPEFREKMAIYSEALKLAWEMHPEISDQMKEIAKEFAKNLLNIITQYVPYLTDSIQKEVDKKNTKGKRIKVTKSMYVKKSVSINVSMYVCQSVYIS